MNALLAGQPRGRKALWQERWGQPLPPQKLGMAPGDSFCFGGPGDRRIDAIRVCANLISLPRVCGCRASAGQVGGEQMGTGEGQQTLLSSQTKPKRTPEERWLCVCHVSSPVPALPCITRPQLPAAHLLGLSNDPPREACPRHPGTPWVHGPAQQSHLIVCLSPGLSPGSTCRRWLGA